MSPRLFYAVVAPGWTPVKDKMQFCTLLTAPVETTWLLSVQSHVTPIYHQTVITWGIIVPLGQSSRRIQKHTLGKAINFHFREQRETLAVKLYLVFSLQGHSHSLSYLLLNILISYCVLPMFWNTVYLYIVVLYPASPTNSLTEFSTFFAHPFVISTQMLT